MVDFEQVKRAIEKADAVSYEVRYNPNHDPTTGQFTTYDGSSSSTSGNGSYVHFVPEGMAGYGTNVFIGQGADSEENKINSYGQYTALLGGSQGVSITDDNVEEMKPTTTVQEVSEQEKTTEQQISGKQETTAQQEGLTNTAESGIIKAEPRGHIEEYIEDKAGFIRDELGVSHEEALVYEDAVDSWGSTNFSLIRQAQKGELNNDYHIQTAKAIEDYIEKAPEWNGGETYRGVREILENDYQKYTTIGNIISPGNNALSSWTSDIAIAKEFSGEDYYDEKSIIFHCQTQSKGTSIMHLSYHIEEVEVLVSSKALYKVTKATEDDDYFLTHVYLEEV